MIRKRRKHFSALGLKWNPFSSDVPTESLLGSPQLDSFCWRVENLAGDGGFALVTGDPGTGKSCSLRYLGQRLRAERDLEIGELTRPQSSIADLYRELGSCFHVELKPHNRWAGSEALRKCWQTQIDRVFFHPVLIVDEAQEMAPKTLNELRFLASSKLDTRSLLTVILAGDSRLPELFTHESLLSLGTRMRVRLTLAPRTPAELEEHLSHLLAEAGAPQLMTRELKRTLCDHAAGNLRTLTNLGNDLLDAAVQRDLEKLDEKLFFDVFTPSSSRGHRGRAKARETSNDSR